MISDLTKVTSSYRKILAARMIVNYLSDKNTLPFLTLIPEISKLLFLPIINNRVDYEKVDFNYLTSKVHPSKLEPDLFASLFKFVYDEDTLNKFNSLHFFLKYLTRENQVSLAAATNKVKNYDSIT